MILFFLSITILYILFYHNQKKTEFFEVQESPETESIHLVIQLNKNDVTFSWSVKDFYDYFILNIHPPKVDLNSITDSKKYLQSSKFVKLINTNKKQLFFKKTIVNVDIHPENSYSIDGFKIDEKGAIIKTISNLVNNSKIPKIPEEKINISYPICEIDGSYRIVNGDPKYAKQEYGPNLDIPSYLDDLTKKLDNDKNQYKVQLV